VLWTLYAFFWVIPLRLNFICRRFGTHCLFPFHRRIGMDTYAPIKMGHSVPKRRHIKFRRRGITQKKAYNKFHVAGDTKFPQKPFLWVKHYQDVRTAEDIYPCIHCENAPWCYVVRTLPILFSLIFFCGAETQRGSWPPHYWEFQITHNDAPQSVGLLWTSDQLVAETSTW